MVLKDRERQLHRKEALSGSPGEPHRVVLLHCTTETGYSAEDGLDDQSLAVKHMLVCLQVVLLVLMLESKNLELVSLHVVLLMAGAKRRLAVA